MNSSFYVKKRKELINKLSDNSLLILTSGYMQFKNADANHDFVVNSNFYYLTGIKEDSVILFVSKINNEVTETLLIKKRNPDLVKWVGETISEEEARTISGITNYAFVDNFEQLLNFNFFLKGVKNVYLDLERHLNKVNDYNKEDLAVKISTLYPNVNIENIYPVIVRQRAIKEQIEIDAIKESIHITNLGIHAILKNLKPNLKEHQLEAPFDYTLKYHGAGKAFPTITAGGKRAVVLHYEKNDQVVNENEMVLFDLGAKSKQNYSADISRTFPVSGKYTPRQKELYNIVLKAHDAVVAAIKPGVAINDLNNIVLETYKQELKRIGLIKEDKEVVNYYYHNVSHMLGIDTHDVGYFRQEPLQENMVLTVEPGLYIESEGVGIRLENDVLVTKDGSINLSKEIPLSIEDIEKVINSK